MTCTFVLEALAAANAYHKLNKRKETQFDAQAEQDTPFNGLKAGENCVEKDSEQNNGIVVCIMKPSCTIHDHCMFDIV